MIDGDFNDDFNEEAEGDDGTKTLLDGIRTSVNGMFNYTEPPIFATFDKMINNREAKVFPDGWKDEEGNHDYWEDVLVLKHTKNDLTKGCRVLLAFVDGNIDNPIIIGVL